LLRINAELLLRVLKQIKATPERWQQKAWVTLPLPLSPELCGTKFCFAGWAAYFSGYAHEWGLEPGRTYVDLLPPETQQALALHPDAPKYSFALPNGRTVVHVSMIASAVLGLDAMQASALFDAFNTLEDLEDIVGALIKLQEERDAMEALKAAYRDAGDLKERDAAADAIVAEATAILERAVPTEPALV